MKQEIKGEGEKREKEGKEMGKLEILFCSVDKLTPKNSKNSV
jgi:hypothetical protein